jgi:hypothetical protein
MTLVLKSGLEMLRSGPVQISSLAYTSAERLGRRLEEALVDWEMAVERATCYCSQRTNIHREERDDVESGGQLESPIVKVESATKHDHVILSNLRGRILPSCGLHT